MYSDEDRKRDPDLGRCRNCLRFIWNPKRKTFLNRTFINWGCILLFYITFLSIVFGMLILMTWITILNINRYDSPWWQQENSRIGGSPGLGFRPILHLKSPIIWYKWNADEMNYNAYVRELNKFLGKYDDSSSQYTVCDEGSSTNSREKPCHFNVLELGSCAKDPYGYDVMAPCVYLKLNKIFNWVPQCFNDTTSLPQSMPASLRNEIIMKYSPSKYDMNTVWVSCDGYFPSDRQHMGEIEYYPRPGFRAHFFPFLGQKHYQSPLVAIKFVNPMRDILISVKCQVWAHNININNVHGGSAVDFQLMIGSKS